MEGAGIDGVGGQPSPTRGEGHIGKQRSLSRNTNSKLRWFGTALPVIYVWTLPFLVDCGFSHTCENWPRCRHTGASVSDFIANTHATGLMAGISFGPQMILWLNVQRVRAEWGVLPTLVAFQICFGLFLSFPVSEVPKLHGMAVVLFCSSAMAHYILVLRFCSEKRYWRCQVLLRVAIFAFAGVFLLVVISRIDPTFIPENCPMIFYVFEALGLSSMALFPLLWYMAQNLPEGCRSGVPAESLELPVHDSRSSHAS